MSRPNRDALTAHPIVFYRGPDGDQKVRVLFREETFWMPQKAIAELFGVGVPAINKHLSNIYESGELEREATRASERRFYQKITDLYALASDYDKDAPLTKEFFATVQNKLHWAITGSTAAEIVHASADASKPHMGLTSWKNAPDGKILTWAEARIRGR